MERFVALLSWMALAVALIAAFLMRHEPRSGNTERKSPRWSKRPRGERLTSNALPTGETP